MVNEEDKGSGSASPHPHVAVPIEEGGGEEARTKEGKKRKKGVRFEEVEVFRIRRLMLVSLNVSFLSAITKMSLILSFFWILFFSFSFSILIFIFFLLCVDTSPSGGPT